MAANDRGFSSAAVFLTDCGMGFFCGNALGTTGVGLVAWYAGVFERLLHICKLIT